MSLLPSYPPGGEGSEVLASDFLSLPVPFCSLFLSGGSVAVPSLWAFSFWELLCPRKGTPADLRHQKGARGGKGKDETPACPEAKDVGNL